MFPLSVCLAAVLAAAPQSEKPQPPAARARGVLTRAIEAMGGEAALKGISTLQIEAIGHDYFIEQSERPEGPFIPRYLQTSEKRDVAGGRSRIETQQRFSQVPDWTGAGAAVIVDADAAVLNRGERYAPAGRPALDDGRERLELAPERMLFTAMTAPDLTAAPDETVHGIVQRVVTFTWRGHKARLLIDSGDSVPTALDVYLPDTWGVWGSVRNTTYFSMWTLLPGGVRYPLQTDRQVNGASKASASIMKITVNAPLDTALFTIPTDAKAAFAALPTATRWDLLKLDPEKQRVEIVPEKIVQYGGNWNVGVVRQPDGLVILEAPIHSSYSVQVLDEMAKRYPGVKVKAVITTSDAWPHIGGVREYVARGIPVYALDLNRPILERLLKADHSERPDALAKAPRPGRFTWISGKTSIGTGDTRMDVYPMHGENGERMLMVYFPALKLLYTSDNIMPGRSGGFYMPETLVEVRDAVTRERLDVERIFGFHIGPTSWSAIEAAISSAASSPAR
jgi:glyoxylase-like metal-dependent hydrolase (beta-lactamase superfamily II)